MDKASHILGVITARGGSKGLPGKNVKLLDGKPLIAYTIDVAKKSKLITHLIVSTDDAAIAEVCRAHGAEVPFMRPAELAQDATPHLPVMQHAVGFMEKREGFIFDIAVIFQPTSPFRTAEDIDGTIGELLTTVEATSSVSICEIESGNHPIKVKKLEGNRVMGYCMEEPEGSRRQDFPTAYKRSSAVYAIRRDVLMVDNRLYGDYVVGHVVPADRSIDIDTPLDWLKTEYMLSALKQQGYDF